MCVENSGRHGCAPRFHATRGANRDVTCGANVVSGVRSPCDSEDRERVLGCTRGRSGRATVVVPAAALPTLCARETYPGGRFVPTRSAWRATPRGPAPAPPTLRAPETYPGGRFVPWPARVPDRRHLLLLRLLELVVLRRHSGVEDSCRAGASARASDAAPAAAPPLPTVVGRTPGRRPAAT